MNLHNVSEICGVADARQLRFLFRRAKAGKVILLVVTQTLQIFLGLRGERRARQELLPVILTSGYDLIFFAASQRGGANHEAIHSKSFLVKKDCRMQTE